MNQIKIKIKFLILFIILANINYANASFENLKEKKVSYLDFFLLKTENNLYKRAQVLRTQVIATRVQYSYINTKIEYNKDKKRIDILIYTVMDKKRYSKKKYTQKLRDCNQVRNLIFYGRTGYTFFKQKREPTFSEGIMAEIFKEVFFSNFDFTEDEIEFILKNMFVEVTIFHPINKKELTCSGNVNSSELK